MKGMVIWPHDSKQNSQNKMEFWNGITYMAELKKLFKSQRLFHSDCVSLLRGPLKYIVSVMATPRAERAKPNTCFVEGAATTTKPFHNQNQPKKKSEADTLYNINKIL